LQDVADRTGLSKPFLSQIENDHVIPPIATLLKLAKAFDVGLAHFFQDDIVDDKIAITRHHERVRVERRPHQRKGEVNYLYEALDTKKANKQMEPFLVEIPAQETGEMVFMTHEGEEFLHVLQGTLEFRTVHRVEVLKAGDSIYFESNLSHSFRCLGEEPAKAMVVVWSK
jgi:quercetin dioxygenase-like cupin family protein/DNA-binding XRE family transcriptional regulator